MERRNIISILLIVFPMLPGALFAAGEGFVSDEHGVAFTPPEGWESAKGRGATIVKFRPKDASPADFTEIAVIAADQGSPMTLESYVAQLKEFNQKTFEKSRVVEERPLTLGAFKAHRLTLSIPMKDGGDLLLTQTVVRRSAISFYSIDCSFVKGKEAAVGGRYEEILKTFREYERRSTPEEVQTYQRFADVLERLADVRKEICLTEDLALFAGEKKIGDYRTAIEEAVVNGKRGYRATTTLTIDAADRGRETVTTESTFTFDFKYQRSVWEDRKVTADGKEQILRMTGVIERDEARIERDLGGAKETEIVPLKKRRVILSDGAEVMRKILLGEEGKDYLAFILPLGDNRPAWDRIEISRRESFSLHGKHFSGDMILLTRERSGSRVFLHDGSRYLIEERIVRSPIVLRKKDQ